ncbi:MAG: 50S ribosomal protein L20 [Endomicrobium sp.]|jgi:large subunit ribosomal protein L20|nr:50S ribosomal protein L20 [Endomicrobium sp.]
MRVKSGVYTRQRKKKFFRLAKGYYASKKNRWRMVIQQIRKSLSYAYTDRKDKKSKFRSLWIVRINAKAREMGTTYNRFVLGLKKSNIVLNRRILAEIAINDMETFRILTDISIKATNKKLINLH